MLTGIELGDDFVEFHFGEGFDLINDDEVFTTNTGVVRLDDCNANEFRCYIVKQKPTKKGARLKGYPIELDELRNMLAAGDVSIEIVDELYAANHFYWRGEITAGSKCIFRRLPPVIIIESMDFFPMTYTWNGVRTV